MNKSKRSQWDEVLLKLTICFLDDISKLSHHEFVNFCLEKNKRDEVEEFLKNIKKSDLKDNALALQKKEEGNEKFKNKQYEESLSLYTESIFHATKADEVLSLSYSNRSLVLERLGYFSESVIDIDLALECGYPKQKAQNLIIRKARCLIQLGDIEKGREILNKALKNNKKKEYDTIIKNELKKLKNLKPNAFSKNTEFKLPVPSGGENECFPCASKYLSIHFDKIRGRHVIANQAISMGEVLFVEKAFAHTTLDKVCCNCCKRTKAPIPCWNCTGAYYCSPKCRDDGWNSFHLFECGFSEFFQSIGIARLGLRVVLKASSSLVELKKFLSNISEPVYENDSIINIRKGYETVYNLVHHSQEYNKRDMFQYTMTALLLALYLKNYTRYFPPETDIEDLNFLSTVILRHILQLICNGFGIYHYLDESADLINYTYDRAATAIYTSASILNHSCDPSINVSFYENYIIIRAGKHIEKGQEVFNDYRADAKRMKKANRQEILRNQYFFDCKCTECVKPYDTYDILTAFKCKKCNGPSITIEENSRNTFCVRCYDKSEISLDTAKKHNTFYSLTKEGELNDDINLSLIKYLQAWRIGREIFFSFNVDLTEAASQVAKLLLELRDFKRCIGFLKRVVQSIENRFGLFSFETAIEMKKLADIIIVYVMNNENKKEVKNFVFDGMSYYMKVQTVLNFFPELKSEFGTFKDLETNAEILQHLYNNLR